jgi:hypothetical protein
LYCNGAVGFIDWLDDLLKIVRQFVNVAASFVEQETAGLACAVEVNNDVRHGFFIGSSLVKKSSRFWLLLPSDRVSLLQRFRAARSRAAYLSDPICREFCDLAQCVPLARGMLFCIR